jgi:hypothetical protein
LQGNFVGGQLETQQSSLRDELWLQVDHDGGGPVADSTVREMKKEFFSALSEMTMQEVKPNLLDPTPLKCISATTPNGLISALKESDAAKLTIHLQVLPVKLQKVLGALPYTLNGPISEGFQVPGYLKYAGAGWIPSETSVLSHTMPVAGNRGESTLEIRTLFIKKEQEATSPDGGKRAGGAMRRWMRSDKQYAEFVTWLDVPSRTWTIFKVFLNDVLACGQNYGALATAEQLAGDPSIFFGRGSGQEGQIAELIGAVADLQCIHVCDVVNWNTYLMMAIVSSESRNAHMFGDHMEVMLKQELVASKLTLEKLKALSPVEVFAKTALGKLVRNILKLWNENQGLTLSMAEVTVSYVRGTYEFIGGEDRSVMNLHVKLKLDDPGSPLESPAWDRMITPFVCEGGVVGRA